MKSIIIAISTVTFLHAQGPLAPPGAPAPTQKSLQEIWDKIAIQQAQITTLQTQNASLQTQLSTVSGMHAISAAGLALPWNINTVDSAGTVGEYYTSLAFGPGGQPAISYYDTTNGDLKFARKGFLKPAP